LEAAAATASTSGHVHRQTAGPVHAPCRSNVPSTTNGLVEGDAAMHDGTRAGATSQHPPARAEAPLRRRPRLTSSMHSARWCGGVVHEARMALMTRTGSGKRVIAGAWTHALPPGARYPPPLHAPGAQEACSKHIRQQPLPSAACSHLEGRHQRLLLAHEEVRVVLPAHRQQHRWARSHSMHHAVGVRGSRAASKAHGVHGGPCCPYSGAPTP
jgi:hypothetical protein